ncbi:hypothetical protein [Streptomyces sp. NPDC008092]|uniref:hypothetical protein n=1 Tax=Streptomyces sp. NPDC008092 TaxID=3364808 RepID=UPI0036DFD58B
MSDEDPQPVYMTATCHTEGCPLNGVPFVAPFYPNTTEPIYRGQCAECGQPITDLVPLDPQPTT